MGRVIFHSLVKFDKSLPQLDKIMAAVGGEIFPLAAACFYVFAVIGGDMCASFGYIFGYMIKKSEFCKKKFKNPIDKSYNLRYHIHRFG